MKIRSHGKFSILKKFSNWVRSAFKLTFWTFLLFFTILSSVGFNSKKRIKRLVSVKFLIVIYVKKFAWLKSYWRSTKQPTTRKVNSLWMTKWFVTWIVKKGYVLARMTLAHANFAKKSSESTTHWDSIWRATTLQKNNAGKELNVSQKPHADSPIQ